MPAFIVAQIDEGPDLFLVTDFRYHQWEVAEGTDLDLEIVKSPDSSEDIAPTSTPSVIIAAVVKYRTYKRYER